MKMLHTPSSLARAIGVAVADVADLLDQGLVVPIAYAGHADRLLPLFERSEAETYVLRKSGIKVTESEFALPLKTQEEAEQDSAGPVDKACSIVEQALANAKARKEVERAVAGPVEELAKPFHQEAAHFGGETSMSSAFRNAYAGTGGPCKNPDCHRHTYRPENEFCSTCWKKIPYDLQQSLYHTDDKESVIDEAVKYLRAYN